MKEFNVEKEKLLKELTLEIKNYPNNYSIKSLKNILKSYQSAKDIHKGMSHLICDSFDLNLSINERLIDFKNYFSDYSNSIKSEELRKIAKYLIKTKNKVTFYGKAWSNCEADWIYFDTVLNLEKTIKKLSLSENVIIHENLDVKSGLERGFVDKITGEGVMGKIKTTDNIVLKK